MEMKSWMREEIIATPTVWTQERKQRFKCGQRGKLDNSVVKINKKNYMQDLKF